MGEYEVRRGTDVDFLSPMPPMTIYHSEINGWLMALQMDYAWKPACPLESIYPMSFAQSRPPAWELRAQKFFWIHGAIFGTAQLLDPCGHNSREQLLYPRGPDSCDCIVSSDRNSWSKSGGARSRPKNKHLLYQNCIHNPLAGDDLEIYTTTFAGYVKTEAT